MDDLPAPVAAAARTIWSYALLNHSLQKSDVIVCLCSNDLRVAERAADVYLAGLAPLLVFSGGVGALTEGLFAGSEASAFAAVAEARGVPRAAMLLEERSTNTGENARFTSALLASRGIAPPRSVIAVQKPYMERRTLATLLKQWPAPVPHILVTSPALRIEEAASAAAGLSLGDIMSVAAGDLQRIAVYPRRGFQVFMPIPPTVWLALQTLVCAGFTSHLIRLPGAAEGSTNPADYEGLAEEEPPTEAAP
jgi:uncharacterized SAM-binding protein YcdF (DUF218 family)